MQRRRRPPQVEATDGGAAARGGAPARARPDASPDEHGFAAMRAERRWLKALLDSMNEEVYFTDTERRYTYANPAAMREFGHASVADRDVAQLAAGLEIYRADGSSRPVEESPALRALRGEVIQDEEQIVRIPRTGELRHRQVSAAPVRDTDGQIIGSVAVVRDVTEQRRLDAALRARDARSRALLELADHLGSLSSPADISFAAAQMLGRTLDASRCGYGTVDARTGTVRVERGWSAALGEVAEGTHRFADFGTFFDELERGKWVVCADVRSDPRTADHAAPLLAQRIGAFVNVPVMEHGQLVALLYVLSEQPRCWSSEDVELIRDVADRTRSTTERRRHQQQLREADRRKDEFIAVLAHELRNPLVPIRAGIDLLKRAAEQPELIARVQPVMERQLGHVVRLIDDLLDVSRITSGKLELQRRPVTLSSVIGSALESNAASIQASGLALDVALRDSELVLDADPTRLSQVISNLLQNAAKFTPPGGHVTLRAGLEPGAQGAAPMLQIDVQDDGVGIDPDLLPRIFDLFVQAPAARGASTGLGIGLALARRLVEMHGGTIEAHSEGVGRGSRFIVRLAVPPPAPVAAPARASSTRPLQALKVLLVDDNVDAADVLALLIAELGATAEVCYGGREALERLSGGRFDVVLLDLGMPGLDGFETCRLIRQAYGGALRIVALTGWGQEEDRRRSLEAGFDEHLTKPVDPARLEQALLQGRR